MTSLWSHHVPWRVPGHVVTFLLLLLLTVTGTDTLTETAPDTEQTTVVTTGCGNHSTLLPAASLWDSRSLQLDLSNLTQGSPATCSWHVPPLNNHSSTVFVFHSTVNILYCSNATDVPGGNYVTFSVGTQARAIQDTCSGRGWKVTNIQGVSSIITFETDSVNGSMVTLGTYSSFTWPDSLCQWSGPKELVANSTAQSFHIPGYGLRLPPGLHCEYSIATNVEHGQVNIRLSNNFTEPVNFSCKAKMRVLDVNEDVFAFFSVPLCDQGLDFHYRGVASVISITLTGTGLSGAPGFTVTYWAEPRENLCPTTPLQLTADTHTFRFLKGVHLAGVGDRQCRWQIRAPSEDLVVRLEELSSYEYISYEGGDTLTLEDGQTLTMHDNRHFPFWSTGPSTNVTFNAVGDDDGRERRFVIKYKAVPRAPCQGHPVPVNTTTTPYTISMSALPLYDGTGTNNTDCRWLAHTNITGHVIRAAVSTASSPMSTPCYEPPAHAFDGPAQDAELQPRCLSSEKTLILTSRGPTMLLIFHRNTQHGGGEITLTAVPDTTSGAGRPLAAAILLCLSAVFSGIGFTSRS